MSILALPRRVLRLQYALARLPVDMIGSRVVSTWDPDSDVRITFQRLVGRADVVAGAITGDRSLSERGSAALHSADLRSIAANLDADADAVRRNAAEDLHRRTDEVRERREAARERADAAIEDAADDELDAELDAGRKATEQLEAARKHADELTERRIAEAEDERAAQLEQIDAAEEAASEPAAESLVDADAKAAEAEELAEDAERIRPS